MRANPPSGSVINSQPAPLPGFHESSGLRPFQNRTRVIVKSLAATVLCAALFLSGCSGTGTMYTPDAWEDASFAETGEETAASENGAPADAGPRGRAGSSPESGEPGEDPRVLKAYLEGTGSDLFSIETLDYYYGFVLDTTALQLPCSCSDIASAGWELQLPHSEKEDGADVQIPPYSYEYFDAVPALDNSPDTNRNKQTSGAEQRHIRLCLANYGDVPAEPSACTVCGIQAGPESGVSLQTVFGAGLGNSLADLTAVFGTDSSIYTLTRYSDGVCSLRYRFSNGLTEEEQLPVLAEAEEKSLAEFILAETGTDGATIERLTLCYFRLPDEHRVRKSPQPEENSDYDPALTEENDDTDYWQPEQDDDSDYQQPEQNTGSNFGVMDNNGH